MKVYERIDDLLSSTFRAINPETDEEKPLCPWSFRHGRELAALIREHPTLLDWEVVENSDKPI